MNPDESGLVVGVDGPEREGGDDQGRLGWRTVWTALLRQPGSGPGSGAAADAADPGSSSNGNGADYRHATITVRSGRPGRESSFARHTRRDCASAVSPRNAPEPAPACRGNGVRRLDRTHRLIDIARFLVATHRATRRRP